MPAPLQTTAVATFAAGTGNETRSLTSVVAGSTIGCLVATYRQDALTPHVTSVTSSNGGALTAALTRTRNSQNAGGGNRLTLTLYLLQNAAAGSHTLTLVKAQTGDTFGSWFAFEVGGVVASSAVDIATDASVDYPNASVSIGPTASLSQAQEFAIAAVAGLGSILFNGSATPPSVAPAGFTAWASYNQVSPFVAVPFQASYADLNSVSPLSAAWTVDTTGIDDGYLAIIVTLKLISGTFFVEILLDPDPNASPAITINNSAGWTVEMSSGSPAAGATIFTNVTAQSTGNKLHVPAPSGVALNAQVNVIAYNTGLGLSGERGVGTVKAV